MCLALRESQALHNLPYSTKHACPQDKDSCDSSSTHASLIISPDANPLYEDTQPNETTVRLVGVEARISSIRTVRIVERVMIACHSTATADVRV